MIMKLYILVGSDGLGKPFWERKLIGENTSREDMQWKEFMGGWYYMQNDKFLIHKGYSEELVQG